jgi:predicted nucleic acid-binding Zn ribbon protein
LSRPVPRRGPRALGSVLSELFARRGFAQIEADRQWQEIWSEVAGADVASHSRVVGLRGGCLEVVVDSSVLVQELATFQREKLLGEIRERLPQTRLRSLRFRVGPL